MDQKRKIATIVVIRHGQKEGDLLTPLGVQQALACGKALKERFWHVDRILYSGARRTLQTALILASGLGSEIDPEVDPGFHFQEVYDATIGDNREDFLAEIEAIKEAGGTIADALVISEYARRGRRKLWSCLTQLAQDMASCGHSLAIIASHSPWAELAGDPPTTPYGLRECQGIIYTIDEAGIQQEVSQIIEPVIHGQKLA